MTLTVLVVVTFLFMMFSVGAMAIGAMVSGRRLKGSCGGVGPGSADCLCAREGRPPQCEQKSGASAEDQVVALPKSPKSTSSPSA